LEPARKGRFTFRTAAVLFGLSALLELMGIDADVPLFGAVVDGLGAAAYHVAYATLFALLAAGLWTGRRYGYYAVFVATAVYSIDRVQLVLWRDALGAYLRTLFVGNEELLAALGLDYLLQVATLMTVVVVACWWGFAAYTYLRRGYFAAGSAPA
jgi:hypothetical protein